MYAIIATLVSLGWTFGAAFVILALISPRIPGSWAWSEVRHAKRRVMMAGVGTMLRTTGVCLRIVMVFAWKMP